MGINRSSAKHLLRENESGKILTPPSTDLSSLELGSGGLLFLVPLSQFLPWEEKPCGQRLPGALLGPGRMSAEAAGGHEDLRPPIFNVPSMYELCNFPP